MSNLPISSVELILIITSIVLFLLYIREYFKREKLSKNNEEVLEQNQQKGYELIHQAIKKAQNILSMAELQGIKVLASNRLTSSNLEEQYEAQLSSEIKTSQVNLSLVSEQFINFINDLKIRSQNLDLATQKITSEKVNQLFEGFENRLSDFLLKTEANSTNSIELELKSTRALIETYKNQQISLVDENIIAMMEQTLAIVLAKKLSLKDQLDLVYEALEKAKVEKFIV